jgi:hypothetical protein
VLEGKYHGHIPGPRHHTALDAVAKFTELAAKKVALDLGEEGGELISDEICVEVKGARVGRGLMEFPIEALVESHSFEPGKVLIDEDLWMALAVDIEFDPSCFRFQQDVFDEPLHIAAINRNDHLKLSMAFLHTIFEPLKSLKYFVPLVLDGPVGSNGGAAIDEVEEQLLLQHLRIG